MEKKRYSNTRCITKEDEAIAALLMHKWQATVVSHHQRNRCAEKRKCAQNSESRVDTYRGGKVSRTLWACFSKNHMASCLKLSARCMIMK